MPSLPLLALFLTIPAAAQTPDASAPPPASKPQDTALTQAKKAKKVLTNEDLSKTKGKISVLGDPKEQPRAAAPTAATPQYIASVRKQLEKLEMQLEDVDTNRRRT